MRYNIEKEVWVNDDDPDLVPIHVDILDTIQRIYKSYNLPPPKTYPDPTKVPGFDLPKKKQVFKQLEIPRKLILLEKKLRARPKRKSESFIFREVTIMNNFWGELDKKRDEYKEEIRWLRLVWSYRLLGYWCWINGVMTWMPGNSFYYLNFWKIDAHNLPEYRDRDRRWWIAQAYILHETRTFANIDTATGKPVDPETGYPVKGGKRIIFKMKELFHRVFFGSNNAKSRRVGDTTKAQCESEEFASRTLEARIGIQGKDDKNAAHVFKNHLVLPFKKKPIFLKPLFDQLDPKNEYNFDSSDPELGLGTILDYATSSDRSAYDGFKLQRYHGDEPGKVKLEDISKRHSVVKECLRLGSDINGFMKYTTTVDEMNRRGGQMYLTLTQDSHWHMRNELGQTSSGLVNTFFKAYDGLEGFVGKYGESIIDEPTPEQRKHIRKDYGAREHLLRIRREKERKKDSVGLAEEKRKYPFTFRECFTPPPRNVFFNMEVLGKRISNLQVEPEWIQGRFDWTNGMGSQVEFVEDPTGPFFLSKTFKRGETNRYYMDEGVHYPQGPIKHIIGADAFRVDKTESGGMSNGGIACLWMHDEEIDPKTKPIKEWISNRFIATYNFRPETTDEYAEDVLKLAIYMNAVVWPESNIDLINKKFTDWGYWGYLLYDIDPVSGLPKKNPGWFTGVGNAKGEIFNAVRDYIQFHGWRCRHVDFLTECYTIPDKDKMTDFDLFTAGGGALKGVEAFRRNQYKYNDQEMEPEVGDMLPSYEY